MSDMLINDPIPSLVQELHELDAELTSAGIAVKDAQDVQRDVKTRYEAKETEILNHLQEHGVVGDDTPLAKLTLRRKPDALIVREEGIIPTKYFKLPDPEPKLDKNVLKADLRAASQLGIEIPGAALEPNGFSLQVTWKAGA